MHILAAQAAGRHQKAIPAEPAAHAFKRWLTTLESLREKTNHQSQKLSHMKQTAPCPASHTRIVYVAIAGHLPHFLQVCAIPFECCNGAFHLCQGARHACRKKCRQKAERLMTFTAVIAHNQCLAALSDAYHGRWGIEELYKISKRLMEIEQFHAKSERGVKQELYAHFVLLALSRSFGNPLEDDLNAGAAFDQPKLRANFKNVLVTVARNFEALMLGNWQLATGNWQLASSAVSNILHSIGNCLQKERPGRSYPRISKRPDDRFRNANRRTRAT